MAYKDLRKDDYVKIVKYGHYGHGCFGTVQNIYLGIHEDYYEVSFTQWVNGNFTIVTDKFKENELLHAVKQFTETVSPLYTFAEDEEDDVESLSYEQLLELVYQQKGEIVRLKMELEGF